MTSTANFFNRRNWLIAIFVLVPQFALARDHVILISVDGLRPSAITQLGAEELPGFYQFRQQGVWTDNARSDFDYTRTLPNHASIMTARGVVGSNGHGQISNSMPAETDTLHNNTEEESYVTSVLDVAHDQGLSTALYVSKDKFIVFEQSYNAKAGAPDKTGKDNGQNKIDQYAFLSPDRTADALVSRFVSDLKEARYNFSMLHIVDTDSAGHGDNWTKPRYLDAVKRVDSYLQKIFSAVEDHPELKNNTAIILVADHGGTGRAHGDAEDIENYVIPFYVWLSGEEGIAAGENLYDINAASRLNPGKERPDYSVEKQPIRNGDAANLALDLLGLPAIPDPSSTINAKQDLKLHAGS